MNYLDQKKGFLGFDANHKSESQVVVVPFGLEKTVSYGSGCKNGPKEFLLNGDAGLLFENNKKDDLFKKLNEFKKLEKNQIFHKKVLAKKNSMKFTIFRHFLGLKNIKMDIKVLMKNHT